MTKAKHKPAAVKAAVKARKTVKADRQKETAGKSTAAEARRHASLAARAIWELAECELCGAALGKPCHVAGEPLADDLVHNVRIAAAEEARRTGLAPTKKPVDLAGIKAPGKLELVDPTKIELNLHNPRRAPADDAAQKAFEESIATQGVLEPILVRPIPAGGRAAGRLPYQLVAGERRFKAALKAIQTKRLPADYRIPATVKALDNRQALIVALTENLARADMHPLDESEAFAKLADNGVGTAEIAAAVNRTQRLVQQRIKVAKDLPEEGKAAMREPRKIDAYGRKGEQWTLSFSQAFAIASIADPKIKARTLRDVLKDYAPDRCNEDWIKRHAESMERSRERSKTKKKGGSSEAAAPRREPEFQYPTPDKNGVYKRPKRFTYPAQESRWGFETIKLRTCCLPIRKKLDAKPWETPHLYIGGYGVQLGSFPEVLEPLTERTGTGGSHDMMEAARLRAVEMMLKEFAPADPKVARALLRDLAKLVDEVCDDGDFDAKGEDALRAKLDAKTEALFPAFRPQGRPELRGEAGKPASPPASAASAASDLAVPGFEKPKAPAPAKGGQDDLEPPPFLDRVGRKSDLLEKPLASPVSSVHVDRAPLTQKIELPKPPNCRRDRHTAMPLDALLVVEAWREKDFPNKAAVAGGVPDELVIEHKGRFFFYRHAGEIKGEPAAVDRAAGANSDRMEKPPKGATGTGAASPEARPLASGAE